MVPLSAAMTGVPRGAMMSTASCVRPPPRPAVYESLTREGSTPVTGMIRPLAANAASGARCSVRAVGGSAAGWGSVDTRAREHATSDTAARTVSERQRAETALRVAIVQIDD